MTSRVEKDFEGRPGVGCMYGEPHLSYSLNSLQGVIKGDTRSLDYSSCQAMLKDHFSRKERSGVLGGRMGMPANPKP